MVLVDRLEDRFSVDLPRGRIDHTGSCLDRGHRDVGGAFDIGSCRQRRISCRDVDVADAAEMDDDVDAADGVLNGCSVAEVTLDRDNRPRFRPAQVEALDLEVRLAGELLGDLAPEEAAATSDQQSHALYADSRTSGGAGSHRPTSGADRSTSTDRAATRSRTS